jgi:hypothetical protein
MDEERTAFGQCLDAATDTRRTPRGGADAGPHPDPTRPFPDRTLTDLGTAGVGLLLTPSSLSFTAFSRSLFQLLDSGVASCSDTRNGRPWPRPRLRGIEKLVEQYGTDVAVAAAKEAREIVQSQDFAPNVTALFAKKCADVAAERDEKRRIVREALA